MSHAQPHTPDPAELEEEGLDPHGFHKEHHGHVILSPFVLLNVLIALLFFTILTVVLSQAEAYFADFFSVQIPHWVNVTVALSIATIKSVLVAMYFMQLKYDAPLDSLIFLFCLFALALFLGFTTLDLGTKGAVYSWKGDYTVQGGTQTGIAAKPWDLGVPRDGIPIVEWAKLRKKKEIAIENGWVNDDGEIIPEYQDDVEAEFQRLADIAHGHEGHDEHHGPVSTPDRSRPAVGLTPHLFEDHGSEGGDASETGHDDASGGH